MFRPIISLAYIPIALNLWFEKVHPVDLFPLEHFIRF